MNQFEVILQTLGLKADEQVLESLRQGRLLRHAGLRNKCGDGSIRERPIEVSLQIILSQIQPGEDCWLWIGPKDWDGYGITYINAKSWRAHRFIYWLVKGTLKNGKKSQVLHHCDTPSCVRPDHLFLGTNQDNIDDCKRKNRMAGPCGELNGSAKLTAEQVQQIRSQYVRHSKDNNLYRLAERFGVNATTVFDIVHRYKWKHEMLDQAGAFYKFEEPA